jgi:DNA-directed RNA polymerase specialized sigma24 family protein
MNERDYLAERFEEHRTHLRAVAYRMLGSSSEVDDAVQEAWLRLSRADALRLTTVHGKITEIEVIGDPARLGGLDLAVVD